MPDLESEPELFKLVKLCQIHSHSRTCWKYKKNKCKFSYGRFFSDRTIISKPLDPSLDPLERNEILDSRKSLLEKVKNYIDVELNPVKVNVIDPQKENYKPHPTIDEMLLKLDISKQDCYQTLSISVDDDYELHLIRPPNSCFINNYFEDMASKYGYSTSLQ